MACVDENIRVSYKYVKEFFWYRKTGLERIMTVYGSVLNRYTTVLKVNISFLQVSDFTWSHDGTQALIAYRDGFVLVGSVSGQRHWSSEINLESQITCGIWTPDDQQVHIIWLNLHIFSTELFKFVL